MDLLDGALEQAAGLGPAPDHADGRPGHGADAAHRGDEHELPPEGGAHVGQDLGGEAAGAGEGGVEPLGALAGAAGELAEADPRVHAGVADVAGRLDPGDDAAEAAEHALGAEGVGELGGRVDAVEEGDDEGVGAEERPHRLRGLGDLPGLHAEEDRVGRAERRRVVGGAGGVDREVAGDAADAEAVLPDGAEVVAPGDEGDVLAGLGEATAEVGADGAGAEDGDAHA